MVGRVIDRGEMGHASQSQGDAEGAIHCLGTVKEPVALGSDRDHLAQLQEVR